MVENFIKTSIMNICPRKVVCTECTRFKCVSQSGNIFSKAKLRKVVLRTPAGQTTESSISDKFRFKLQSGRPHCIIHSRGRTDTVPLPSFILCMGCRDLLLSHKFVGQLPGADRRLQAKWHGKAERRRDIRNILVHCQQLLDASCFLRIGWWRNLSILRISSQLWLFLSFGKWNPVTLADWSLFDFIFGLLQLYLFPFVEDWVVGMEVSSSSWCSAVQTCL